MSELKNPITLADLSVIVPIGLGDETWKFLAMELISLPLGTEIIFVATEFDAAAMSVLSKTLAPGRKVKWLTAKAGRASQMNAAAKHATKPYLWFLHADSQFEERSLIALEQSLIREPLAIHYFNLKYAESVHGLMKLNEIGVWFRSHVFKMPFGDQGFVVSRDTFQALGCYREDVPYGEDHLLIWKARQSGVKLKTIQACLKTSARKFESKGWLKTTLLHQYLTYKQALPEYAKLMKIVKFVTILCFFGHASFSSAANLSPVMNPVWIDTDISIGVPFHDVDDGYAIAHAVTKYPERVVGISTTYGNSRKVGRSVDLVNEILSLSGHEEIPVSVGASDSEDFDTDGANALANELESLNPGQSLTILAIGRLTNLKAALLIFPAGASRIKEVVFVGGRRSEGEPHVGRWSLTLTDSNFWGDEDSFTFLLDQHIPLTLLPTELAQQFEISRSELRLFKYGTPLTYWLARKSKLWLLLWEIGLGENGFYPFDLMASAYVTLKANMHCDENIPMKILALPDTHFFNRGRTLKNRPVVSFAFTNAPYRVRYCDSVTEDFHDLLMSELTGGSLDF